MFENLQCSKNSTSPLSKRPSAISSDPENFTARQLYEQCRVIGSLALKSRRQFIGLLPLVERRQAYRGHGLYSTYDLAGKLGGISYDIVTEVLRLDAQLRDFPLVRKLLYRGEVGWSKIRMVMSQLTEENQEEWIYKLKNLPNRALTQYLHDFTIQKHQESQGSIIEMGGVVSELTPKNTMSLTSYFEKTSKNEAKNFGAEISEYNREIEIGQMNNVARMTIDGAQFSKTNWQSSAEPEISSLSKFSALAYERETFTFSLNRQIAARMRLFRQKLERERKELITWEEVMIEFLKNIDEPKFEGNPEPKQTIVPKETSAAKEIFTPKQLPEGTTTPKSQNPATRHIPNDVKREVLARHAGLCAYQNCAKPAEILHHSKRFALTSTLTRDQTHDANFIKPLCKPHERVIHNTLIANEDLDPSIWKLLAVPDTASPKHEIDQIVAKYRKPK